MSHATIEEPDEATRDLNCGPGATARIEALEGRVFLSASGRGSDAKADHGPRGDHPKANALVYPQGATVRGATLGQWAAEWTKWALSAPVSVNPLLDTTGENADYGQPKKVDFLAGGAALGDNVITRDITVPTGTPLFFPVLNIFWVNVDEVIPGVYDPADPPFATNEFAPGGVRDTLKFVTDQYQNPFATIDGKSVPDLPSHIEEDPAGGFQADYPDDPAENVLNVLFSFLGGDVPTSTFGRNATRGIYLMTKPLKPGEHTIHFGGTDPAFGSTQDITYHITVLPKGHDKDGKAACAPKTFSSGPRVASLVLDDDRHRESLFA